MIGIGTRIGDGNLYELDIHYQNRFDGVKTGTDKKIYMKNYIYNTKLI